MFSSQGIDSHITFMADLIPKSLTEPGSGSSSATNTRHTAKPGRKSKFTAAQDLIIAQEVAAAEAHVTPHGETLLRFEKASKMANNNPNFGHKVTGKNLQDRFKKLLEDYALRDGRDRKMSGTGGELGELDPLVGDMLEAKRDREARKDGDAKDKADQESRKLAAGKEMILQTFKVKARRPREGSSDEDTAPKKRRIDLTDGMPELGSALKKSERVRFELEKEKLNRHVEEKREERAECAVERQLRKEDMQLYLQTMEKMMSGNSKQMQAVFGLVGSALQQSRDNK